MVRLTIDMIAKSRKNFKKRWGPSYSDNLETLTHLHFSYKNIDSVGDISVCRNLSTVYLQDNQMTSICNLDFAPNLTHLYLQNNNITHIDNLCNNQHLSTLYLGGNRIAVVEGLELLGELTELHVERQKLPPGEKLLLEPRTLLALAESLWILDISNNNIDDVQDLAVLKELRHFSAVDNKLHNMEELEDVFSCWPELLKMDLGGNPVCRMPKYRDRLITACKKLEFLDGKEIHEVTRQFMDRKASEEATSKKKKIPNERNARQSLNK